ncbi:hypothetical protein CHARACLAT_003685 [Characodon lateralis]|uniref:Uncharacterized protein n=1 Tax=Characodon lateralis TaxID=208331 RepID=A0ABU7F0X7_9TELE|nr:hypothetical protein [Characodon lateralis]
MRGRRLNREQNQNVNKKKDDEDETRYWMILGEGCCTSLLTGEEVHHPDQRNHKPRAKGNQRGGDVYQWSSPTWIQTTWSLLEQYRNPLSAQAWLDKMY